MQEASQVGNSLVGQLNEPLQVAGYIVNQIQERCQVSRLAVDTVAAYKNPAKTAMDMGHIGGLRILRNHYVGYVPKAVAKEFWALRPKGAPVATAAIIL